VRDVVRGKFVAAVIAETDLDAPTADKLGSIRVNVSSTESVWILPLKVGADVYRLDRTTLPRLWTTTRWREALPGWQSLTACFQSTL
jgi:hypothetical protein